MKTTIGFNEFTDRFDTCRPDNFTYDGLQALFDYLEQLEEDIGKEIELDVIALCCEYIQYDNIAEFNSDYGYEYDSIDEVEKNTTVIRVDDDSFIIQDF